MKLLKLSGLCLLKLLKLSELCLLRLLACHLMKLSAEVVC